MEMCWLFMLHCKIILKLMLKDTIKDLSIAINQYDQKHFIFHGIQKYLTSTKLF